MKTKVYIRTLLTILAAVSFGGACSKVDRVSADKEIVLSPYGTSLTKADAEPLGIDKVFGVYAYNSACSGGTEWNKPGAWESASAYLENVAFSYQSGSWAGRDQSYYWPWAGSLMFAGYCPYMDVSGGTITDISLIPNKNENNPYLQISFTQNPSDMVNLLWFDVKDVAAGTALEKRTESIPVTFRHALSKVSFTFADSHNHYKLKSATLKGLVNKGTFYSGNTPGWMPELARETLRDYTLLAESQVSPTLNAWTSADMYIIPQYLDGIFPTIGETLDSGVDVVLAITLTDGFGSQTVELLLKDYTERWELGKSYQYTITVNADPIEFDTPSFTITTQVVSM